MRSSQRVLLATSLVVFASAARAQPAAMDVTKWREDLAVFREQMPKQHGNLFHTLTRAQFEKAVDDLEAKLPTLSSNQIKTGILRLVAMVKDGHTRVRQETLGNHMLPVRLRFFADGLFVEAGDRKYASVVGAKVKAIGALSADEAFRRVRPLVPVDGENEGRCRLLGAELLVTPEVLQAIGATQSAASVELTVEKDGRETKVRLPAAPFRPWENHGWPKDPAGWINARTQADRPDPLWLRNTHRSYWHQYIDGGKTLYVQLNEVEDQVGGEPMSRYFPRLFQEADARHVERVILDLRLNGGGNNELIRPLWHALIKSDRLNQKGRLWVLIGSKTFSAATSLVDELELNTQATFAGEPTGETPNQWGDPNDLTLPNSGIVIQASTLWWQLEDPRDHRDYRAPDLAVSLTFADYAHGIDPVLQAIERAHP